MKCFNCRGEIPDGSKFCPHCGSAQREPSGSGANIPADSETYQSAQVYYPAGNQAPAYVTPAQTPVKKSYKGLIITLSVVGGVILLGLAVFLLWFFGVFRQIGAVLPETDTTVTSDVTVTDPSSESNATASVPDTGSVPDGTETDAPAASPYFDSRRVYVYYMSETSDLYYPCVEFYPSGEFVFTENLLMGMGKIRGTYSMDGDRITLDVTSSYDSGFAGSNRRNFGFVKNGDSLTIDSSLCSTVAGSVFVLNNGYAPSEEFYIGEDHGLEYPDEAYNKLDPTLNRWVNVGRNAGGEPYTLFMRSSPNKEYDGNRICAVAHGSVVTVYAYSYDYSWAWGYYDGYANDVYGNSTYYTGYGWCAAEYLSEYYPG